MRVLKVAISSLALATLSVAPAMAAQERASAQTHAVDVRNGENVEDANRLGGGLIVGILAAAAVIAGIIIIADGDDEPTSP